MNIENLYSTGVYTQKGDYSTRNDYSMVDRAMLLIDNGHFEEADLLVSAELLFCSGDAQLWLVAGLARFHKGNLRSARAAFRMSAWLDDNAMAREMLAVIER